MQSKKKKSQPWPVLVAIALAIFLGTITGKEFTILGISLYSIYELIGKLFINSLTLIVIPLVASSIITGVAKIGSESQFGRLGIKIFIFYFLTKIVAIVIGVLLVNILHPGNVHMETLTKLVDPQQLAALQANTTPNGRNAFVGMLLDLIPSNIFEALSRGNMLGLIFFSTLFGYAITHITAKAAEAQLNFWNGVFEATINMTNYIIRFLPLGVFCLVAKVFAETGLDSLRSVALFFTTVVLGLAAFIFIALPLMLKFIAKVNPWNQFRVMAPALITAFSTSSSSAALPITLECMEKRGGVSNRICSLVLPLGISINLTGSALYEGVAAIFIAQSFGIELSLLQQFLFIFFTLLTSIGIAGVPSGSLVMILVLLRMMGLPLEGIGLLLAVDRILDMFRTVANIFADGCCAVLVAKSEGEKNILTRKTFQEL